ncbi:MAG: uroporphyrinogen decarboxylase [Lentisphaerae bacterium]|nr:uroporphyrinogen decarboxylase [Lentisphaerota bacterium]
MTPRERILESLAHRQPATCPYILGFSGAMRERLVAHTGDPAFDRVLETQVAGVGPSYPEAMHRVDATHYRDAYGVIWEQSEADEYGMVRDPIMKERSFANIPFPSTNVPGLWDKMPAQLAENRGRFTVWSLGFSLFERAWSLRGMEDFMMDMIEDADFAHALLDRICDVNVALVEQACQFPVDCIRFGDDWGAQKGLMMGARHWREFIKPRFARMVQAARSRGKFVLLHSDGDIREIIPDLIEVGLSILNPIQSDSMDIAEIKQTFGQKLCFLGGLSVQHTLPEGTPDDVRAEIRRLIRVMGAGGGYILCPTHSMGPDIPAENLLAMMDEFAHQGRG